MVGQDWLKFFDESSDIEDTRLKFSRGLGRIESTKIFDEDIDRRYQVEIFLQGSDVRTLTLKIFSDLDDGKGLAGNFLRSR